MRLMNTSMQQESLLHVLYTEIPEEYWHTENATTMSGFDICQHLFYPVDDLLKALEGLIFVGLAQIKTYEHHYRLTSRGRRYYEEFLKGRHQ